MGVTLAIRLIDHEHVVENGLRVVNDALSANDPGILVDYIASLPFNPEPEVVANRQARYDKLRALNAPDPILQNEERMLRLATGEAYARDVLTTKSMDELREVLGTWGWAHNSFNLGKAWQELDWFLQPADGPHDSLMLPQRPQVGDPAQTDFDRALNGSEQSPSDNSGLPIIRSCGSQDTDCFGYNPPESIAAIHSAIIGVDEKIVGWSCAAKNRSMSAGGKFRRRGGRYRRARFGIRPHGFSCFA